MAISRLEIPLSKTEYLFSHSTAPGEGGDKQKLWREVLGFESAESIRESILAQVTLDMLEVIAPNPYGQRYQAIVTITGPSGKERTLRTIWIVITGETIARLVTVIPRKSRSS